MFEKKWLTTILTIALALILFTSIGYPAKTTLRVTGSALHLDKHFPQFAHLWQEGWSLKDDNGNILIYAKPDMPLGGYLFVYYQNTGGKAITIEDLAIEGVKLSEGIGITHATKNPEEKFGASILLSKLPKEKLNSLQAAGAPVWWKPEPREVPPGGMGEIVVRLKKKPTIQQIKVDIISDGGNASTIVSTAKEYPRFTTIAFTPDLSKVYLYVRHPKGNVRLGKIYLDKVDITPRAKIAPGQAGEITPIIINLDKPLKWMSYHNFTAVFQDGSEAIAGIRAWGREMVYGMWGAGFVEGEPKEAARKFLMDWKEHNINVLMGHISGSAGDYVKSDEGWELAQSLGFDRMTTWDTGKYKPVFFFLQDEPDAHDAANDALKPADRLGSLGQWLVKWQEVLRRHDPDVPVLLNIDNTYKPENWYMYHQLSDIPCIDPYFPEQQDYCFNKHPGAFFAHTKPTYVYAVSTISQSSAQPKPLHTILCSTRYRDGKGYEGRFPTPEEKRMEVYYTISAGAKGISYWWFSPDVYCIGVGKDEPAAHALWKEIGLLGAEVRTAGPVITVSTPVSLPTKSDRYLWVRSLLSGMNTVAVIIVNDDVACDRLGTVFKPVQNAHVSIELPKWIKPTDAFEVTYEGIKDIAWKKEGNRVALDLGTVNISRFVIITADSTLKANLKKRYETMFAANVAKLLAQEN
ncbi:MAG: hypothetical protein QHH26_01315 [Armatimonadota bacterium]|nr:hypothetical protein [Armatimonadota bacterium]